MPTIALTSLLLIARMPVASVIIIFNINKFVFLIEIQFDKVAIKNNVIKNANIKSGITNYLPFDYSTLT